MSRDITIGALTVGLDADNCHERSAQCTQYQGAGIPSPLCQSLSAYRQLQGVQYIISPIEHNANWQYQHTTALFSLCFSLSLSLHWNQQSTEYSISQWTGQIEWYVRNASSDTFFYWSPVTKVIWYGSSFMRFLDAPQSAGHLWTSGQFVAETSTWQHTTLTTDKRPCLRWDSNPRTQQASGRRPTP